MPGLLSLRPGLGSASKTAKSTTANKHGVSSARIEKGRDERSLIPQGGKVPAPSAFARRGVYRAPSLNPASPHITPTPVAAQQAARPKQVSGLLGHIVEAQLQQQPQGGNGLDITQGVGTNYSSSGSEHEINSVCLAEMVHEFMEDEAEVGKCGHAPCTCEDGTCGDSSEGVDDKSSLGGELAEILQGLIPTVTFSEKAILNSVTANIQEWSDKAELASNEREGRSLLMRYVMSSLRASGYNAAICKSRWEHAGGFPGGDYEYIDVILGGLTGTNSVERIIVDIDFKTQFKIARPTPQYAALLQTVPAVFVGKADRLQQIVNILCEAAKRSLKKKGMPLPPWRKPEYIRAKWFTSYRRTINESPASSSSCSRESSIGRIALRGAGWDSKFTTEMESIFHKAADVRKVPREGSGVSTSKMMTTVASKQQMEEMEPEGVVRGAHRALTELQQQLLSEQRNSATSSSNMGEIGAAGSEWELPVVNLKPSAQKTSRKVAGLSTVLKEAGMIAQSAKNLPDAFYQEQQRSALSRELALERA